MEKTYYLVFAVDRIPDLTLTKYSVLDGSSVDDIIEKHGVFLRQLHRLGSTAGVYFHLLYYYDPDERIKRGHHLSVVFYATSTDKKKLDGIREFLTTSVLSTYYDFHCYEVSSDFRPDIIVKNNDDRLANLNDIFPGPDEKGTIYPSPVRGLLSLNKYVFGKKIRLSDPDHLRLYTDENDDENDLFCKDYPIDKEKFTKPLLKALADGMKAESGETFICYFDENKEVIKAIERQKVQYLVNLVNVSGTKKQYGIT